MLDAKDHFHECVGVELPAVIDVVKVSDGDGLWPGLHQHDAEACGPSAIVGNLEMDLGNRGSTESGWCVSSRKLLTTAKRLAVARELVGAR